nr:hypothetical protein (rrn 5' region) - Halobacterium salinarum [Halobacterium salinarum]
MVREDGKRNFAHRTDDGTEPSVISGITPRQAALKAARRLDDVGESESEADRNRIELREKGDRQDPHLRSVGVGGNRSRRQTRLDAGRHHQGKRLQAGHRPPRDVAPAKLLTTPQPNTHPRGYHSARPNALARDDRPTSAYAIRCGVCPWCGPPSRSAAGSTVFYVPHHSD